MEICFFLATRMSAAAQEEADADVHCCAPPRRRRRRWSSSSSLPGCLFAGVAPEDGEDPEPSGEDQQASRALNTGKYSS